MSLASLHPAWIQRQKTSKLAFMRQGATMRPFPFKKDTSSQTLRETQKSLPDAIASAIGGVIAAGAVVDRVEPDPLVSLADMAARAGLTRAAMTNYSQGKRGSRFPSPVAKITSESPLWDWATVARWMYENEKLDKETAIEAEVVRLANDAICSGETNLGERLKRAAQDYSAKLEAA